MANLSGSGAIELGSAIQSASLNPQPSTLHDLNPSTAASARQPVTLSSTPAASDIAEDEIPVSILRPIPPGRAAMPPLPDLRFEQSYLRSIQHAESWKGVAWITVRDQIFLPLVQGTLWTLVLSGWRHWNRSARFSGQSVGARLRRWWYQVNNWTLPTDALRNGEKKRRLASKVQEYYQHQFSSAVSD